MKMSVTSASTTYKPFYVYCHKENQTIVYVGKGSEGRAWASNGRKGKHKPFMDSRLNIGDSSFVEFISFNMKEEDAIELEELIIKEAQPIYNRFFTDEWKQSNKERGLKGAKATMKTVHTPYGIFESVSEAARQLNIGKSCLFARVNSKHSNMKEYYYV